MIAHELAHVRLELEAAGLGKARRFFSSDRTREFLSGFYVQAKERLRRKGWQPDAIEKTVTEDAAYVQAVLLNRPLDMVVETWIRRHIPCLSAAQFLGFNFNRDLDRALILTPTEILSSTESIRPLVLRRSCLALDCARNLMQDSFFPGVTDFARVYLDTEVFPLAQQLWQHWLAVLPSLGSGDRFALIEAFASILGLSQAYESESASLVVPPAHPPRT